MPKRSPPDTSPVARFEQSLQELEQLVQNMETGALSLEQSLGAYERGIALYRECHQALEQAQLRVRILSDPMHPDDGEPFDPSLVSTSQ
ncbi:exodeoxyribonuclease VII small subunit [Xylella fastidiosa subsp. fastidiosa]|jgi:exodeoxyribonuclease VII small subunit|uniref:Exodeoxyribonuclease 7 small subunit n=4 Tax=Xylella fastidiosa TaxID=2371 RepID=EX7S_XYLFT|nr:exodeoxyribonuclease VII small subunit [Xylella fastidiosa]B2I7B1.1 RecName: Full=Exodeoxyribonuclease 7 small subunit; AltName: Full=Exodeoxyribonuclease VII small subunit; Short=Exonuclease VII small subunit [Xylella fastidiosa M23]Q87BE3.1 RecName: Full=Exodeoxyribonuclease 7 small subunit; AltName: Full=Exodeoxyribonuclease VII small subunit; Short=Exonuclease VII small subunit [Xylella fastidiosa Temecula1]ADN62356.1 exodeoxyribonuclease VII small subunit [Xylella fastidiosa subsp. fasti